MDGVIAIVEGALLLGGLSFGAGCLMARVMALATPREALSLGFHLAAVGVPGGAIMGALLWMG